MAMNTHPNNYQAFTEAVATGKLEPSRQNLYGVSIAPPLTLRKILGTTAGDKDSKLVNTGVSMDQFVRNVNLFSSSVTIPSRAVTTGQVNNHGMMRRFGTGQTSSQISMSFLSTKDNFIREWFEMWLNVVSSDSDNTVGFYDDYTTSAEIIKWEVGSNVVQSFDFYKAQVPQVPRKYTGKATLNQATAVYQFYNLFPFNISTQTLDNEQASLMRVDIQFYYERYRFDTVNVDTLKWLGPKDDGRNKGISEDAVAEKNAQTKYSAYGT